MESIVLLCTDGSDVAIEALRVALPILAPADRTIVVTVESDTHPELIAGNGFAGRSTEDLSDQIVTTGDIAAKRILDATVEELRLDDVEITAIVGEPGEAICRLAAALPATAIVIATSGRSGLRRAIMGSTSDHVVRHAPCPVVVQGVGQR
jgi:nucleotide-binding universal stress UspA family protein